MRPLLFFWCFIFLSCGRQESTEKPTSKPEVPNLEWPTPENPFPYPWPLPIELPEDFPLPPIEDWPNPVPLPPDYPEDGTLLAKETFLKFHNEKRCWHNAPPLVWNESLAQKAKQHADRCVFAHDATANAGENLALGYGGNSDPNGLIAAMTAWYLEVSDYKGNWSPATGHFSQMVWKDTSELGCAVSQCPLGEFVVCRYLEAGNVLGRFRDNVLPLRADLDQCS